MLCALHPFRLALAAGALALVFSVLPPKPANAQAPAYGSTPPQTAGPESTYTISGTVLNSASGQPLRRALVQVATGGNPATLTDGEGHFEFHDLPGGRVTISATKPGFFNDQELSQGQTQTPLFSIPGSDPVVLRLTPEGVITGRVEAGSEPLENVSVKVFALRIADGRKRWEVRSATTTDEDGAYRIANLPPGPYYIAAGPSVNFNPGAEPASGPRELGYPEVFYPGAPDLESATAIELTPGQQAAADLSLKGEPVYHLDGMIAGTTGRGVNLQLLSRSGDDLPFPVLHDPVTGKFRARVLAGSYTLRAFAQNPGGSASSAEQNLVITSDRSGLRLMLGPSAPIPVNVRMDAVNPERASGVQFRGGVQPLNVHLIPAVTSLNSPEFYANAGPSGRGELALRDVLAGQYTVDIAPNGEWYVSSAVSGGTDLLREDLTIPPGARTPPIEVVLRNDGASLTVAISSDGQPASGSVLLISERAPNQIRWASTSQEEQAGFSGLAPGEYSVLAFDRLDALEYRNPEVLSGYLSRASHVVLMADGKAEVTAELIRVEK